MCNNLYQYVHIQYVLFFYLLLGKCLKASVAFIDIFINEDDNGKIVRCHEKYINKCEQLDKSAEWWWKWINYPSKWILERKRFKFESPLNMFNKKVAFAA